MNHEVHISNRTYKTVKLCTYLCTELDKVCNSKKSKIKFCLSYILQLCMSGWRHWNHALQKYVFPKLLIVFVILLKNFQLISLFLLAYWKARQGPGSVSRKNKMAAFFVSVCLHVHHASNRVAITHVFVLSFCLTRFSLKPLFVGIYVLAVSFLGYGISKKQDTDELG